MALKPRARPRAEGTPHLAPGPQPELAGPGLFGADLGRPPDDRAARRHPLLHFGQAGLRREAAVLAAAEHGLGQLPLLQNGRPGLPGEGGLGKRPAGAPPGDEERRPRAPDLAGVEGRPARPRDAVRAADLADGEEAAHARLPPDRAAEAAVVVLGADGDLERLAGEVDAVRLVEGDGRGVHLPQPGDRRRRQGARPFEIGQGLRAEQARLEGGQPSVAAGVAAEIEEDAAALDHGLLVDEEVDERRAAARDLARIERPLIALEEHGRGQRPHVGEVIVEELPLVAARRVRRDVAGHGLLVGAGDVPAELDRGQPELGFGQVVGGRAGFEEQAVRAGLAFGIDRVLVHAAGPARGRDDVHGVEEDEAAPRPAGFGAVEGQDADRALGRVPGRPSGRRSLRGRRRPGCAGAGPRRPGPRT